MKVSKFLDRIMMASVAKSERLEMIWGLKEAQSSREFEIEVLGVRPNKGERMFWQRHPFGPNFYEHISLFKT
jgi:hypothetical protein